MDCNPRRWMADFSTALREHKLSRRQGLLASFVFVGILYSIDPAAAQEGCSSALDSVFTTGAGMVFGYGRPVVAVIAFVAFIGMITTPIHPLQSVVAGGVLVLIIVGIVALIGITAFTQQSFDAMGAPDACVEIIGTLFIIGKPLVSEHTDRL